MTISVFWIRFTHTSFPSGLDVRIPFFFFSLSRYTAEIRELSWSRTLGQVRWREASDANTRVAFRLALAPATAIPPSSARSAERVSLGSRFGPSSSGPG